MIARSPPAAIGASKGRTVGASVSVPSSALIVNGVERSIVTLKDVVTSASLAFPIAIVTVTSQSSVPSPAASHARSTRSRRTSSVVSARVRSAPKRGAVSWRGCASARGEPESHAITTTEYAKTEYAKEEERLTGADHTARPRRIHRSPLC